MRTREAWGADSSLYFRVISAVETMVRGKGKYGHRVQEAMVLLSPILASDLPDEVQQSWKDIWAAIESTKVSMPAEGAFPGKVDYYFNRMSPGNRDKFTQGLLHIHKLITVDKTQYDQRRE